MIPLTSVVGHTTSTASRVLAVFTQAAGARACISYENGGKVVQLTAPTREALPYKLACFELEGLEPGPVRYAVESYADFEAVPDAVFMLRGLTNSFRTLPPGPPRVGLLSCNDLQNDAVPEHRRAAMWRRLRKLVEVGEVDLLLHAGDQIYGDTAPRGWDPSEGRAAAYRRHYVNTWSNPDVAKVLGSCPNLMIWDDHEIYDGWGSNDKDTTPAARERYRAAELAFSEFQVPLNPTDRFTSGYGWWTQIGELGVLCIDGRSQRDWAKGEVLGPEQQRELRDRLNAIAALNLRHLFVISATPIVYVPTLIAERLSVLDAESVDDVRDSWIASNNLAECRMFLASLLDFAGQSPRTQVSILSGDVHVSSIAQIDTRLEFGAERRRPRFYQITSSGIGTPAPTGLAWLALSLVINGTRQDLSHREIEGCLRRLRGCDHDFVIAHRNFAIIDPSDGRGTWDEQGSLRVRFHTERSPDDVSEQLLPRID